MPVEFTWALLLVIVGGILGVGAIAVAKKKQSRKMLGWFGGIGLALGIIAMLGLVPQLEVLNQPILEEAPLRVTPSAPSAPEAIGCVGIEDTTVRLSAVDKYTGQPSGGSHRYSVNGAPALTVSDAGTFTASPGETLNILWGNETTTTYFGVVTTEVVPCAGTKTFTAQTERNGTLTIQVFNSDQNKIESGVTETLASGEDTELDMYFKGTNEYGFPHGGLVVAEYATLNYTSVKIDVPGVTDGNVPSVHTVSSTERTATAQKIPALSESTKLEGTLLIDTIAGVNPEPVRGNISLYFYPLDYFINEDRGSIYDGPAVEDEDNTRTFLARSTLEVGVT